uniref:Cuticle protein n=1 Tax=Heliothis virescens TaxID=7102 RepID=A0A2A4JLT2_HELVI
MAAKFIILSLLVASAYGSGGYSSFSYGVSDPITGDVKDQHEKRVGDSVVGKYSLLESDGTKRIVEYAANAATGFNAVVRKEPGLHAPLVGAALHGSLAHGPVHLLESTVFTPVMLEHTALLWLVILAVELLPSLTFPTLLSTTLLVPMLEPTTVPMVELMVDTELLWPMDL